MRRIERQAIVKLFVDLIKADRIIELGEMSFFHKMKEKYAFTRADEIAAAAMTFAEAANVISQTDDLELKDRVLSDCRALTESDGFRARSEALIMAALLHKLDDKREGIDILSVPKSEFDIQEGSVLYIESQFDKNVNRIIKDNYRLICKEFQVAGFHFIYIPAIIDHYRATDRAQLTRIISFLAPQNSDEGINHIIDNLMSMTTESFCRDILCNKLAIDSLRNCSSSLLIKLGNGYVGNDQYANYLKIEVDNDMVASVQDFLDEFTRMIITDVITVSTSEESEDQFLYHGFYKELLDIFLIKKNIRSRIFIDTYKDQIYLPDIDKVVSNFYRRERALYALLLFIGNRGMNFNPPTSQTALKNYNKRMDRLQKQYNYLYEKFGGKKDKAPDIRIPEIRRPIFSCIRTAISSLADELYNPADYMVSKDSDGVFSVNIDPNLVFCVPSDPDKKSVLFTESEIYKELQKY